MNNKFPFSEIWILLAIFIAIGALLPDSANAGYLDPGSGSTLVQGIIAFLAGIRRFFARITGIFSGKKGK